jgi:hypothetical protein
MKNDCVKKGRIKSDRIKRITDISAVVHLRMSSRAIHGAPWIWIHSKCYGSATLVGGVNDTGQRCH